MESPRRFRGDSQEERTPSGDLGGAGRQLRRGSSIGGARRQVLQGVDKEAPLLHPPQL